MARNLVGPGRVGNDGLLGSNHATCTFIAICCSTRQSASVVQKSAMDVIRQLNTQMHQQQHYKLSALKHATI